MGDRRHRTDGRRGPGRRWLLALVVLACLAGLAPAATAADQVIGRPTVELFLPDDEVTRGAEHTLSIQIANEGALQRAGPAEHVRRVTTARATTIEVLAGEAPIEVHTGRYAVGTVPQGTTGPVPVRVTVPEDARLGTYELPVRVRYTYTRIVDYGGRQVEYTDQVYDRVQHVTVRVVGAPRFEVVSADTSVRVGDRGPLSIAVRNVGSEVAREATLRLESRGTALTFGGDSDVSTVIGRWGVGELHRVDVPVDLAPGAPVRPYAIDATVAFEGADGAAGSKTVTATVVPRGAPSFAVASVEADLRVDARGRIAAVVENTGETTARDAVVGLAVPWSNRTATAGVGDLPPGGSAEVTFATTVPPGIEPGSRRVTLHVDHAASTGARRLTEPLGATVDVGPRRSAIGVEPVAATFEVDAGDRLVVQLTNRAVGPITDVRAVLTATDPLSSDDPAAFVPRLDEDASTTVAFDLDVGEDAVAGQHPVALSFTYEDADGTTRRISDVPVGVAVVEPTGPGFPIAAVAVVAISLAVAVGWWYRRR